MAAKVKYFPNTFERPISSLKPDDGGFEVVFECGHTVFFAIEPDTRYAYNCSLCFEEFMAKEAS